MVKEEWVFTEDYDVSGYWIVGVKDTDKIVCWTDDEKNARLISASLDLLTACENFLKVKEDADKDEVYSLNVGLHQLALWNAKDMMEKAIKKAKGG